VLALLFDLFTVSDESRSGAVFQFGHFPLIGDDDIGLVLRDHLEVMSIPLLVLLHLPVHLVDVGVEVAHLVVVVLSALLLLREFVAQLRELAGGLVELPMQLAQCLR
jgi:hypothetical protein